LIFRSYIATLRFQKNKVCKIYDANNARVTAGKTRKGGSGVYHDDNIILSSYGWNNSILRHEKNQAGCSKTGGNLRGFRSICCGDFEYTLFNGHENELVIWSLYEIKKN